MCDIDTPAKGEKTVISRSLIIINRDLLKKKDFPNLAGNFKS